MGQKSYVSKMCLIVQVYGSVILARKVMLIKGWVGQICQIVQIYIMYQKGLLDYSDWYNEQQIQIGKNGQRY